MHCLRELPPGTHGFGSHPTYEADALLGQPGGVGGWEEGVM